MELFMPTSSLITSCSLTTKPKSNYVILEHLTRLISTPQKSSILWLDTIEHLRLCWGLIQVYKIAIMLTRGLWPAVSSSFIQVSFSLMVQTTTKCSNKWWKRKENSTLRCLKTATFCQNISITNLTSFVKHMTKPLKKIQ